MTTKPTRKVYPVKPENMNLAREFNDAYEEHVRKRDALEREYRERIERLTLESKALLRQKWTVLASSVGLDPDTYDNRKYAFVGDFLSCDFAAISFDNSPVVHPFFGALEDQDDDEQPQLDSSVPDGTTVN